MDRSSFLNLMLSTGLISSATPIMSNCNSSNTASGEFHALLIGITQYGPQEQLKTDRDCKELSTVLKQAGYKTAEIITGNIRVKALTEQLETFKNKASENDTLLFFFAGHGEQDGTGNDVLSIHNGSNIESVRLNLVANTLMSSKAASIILVFDCCRRKVNRQSTAQFRPRLGDFKQPNAQSNSKKVMMIQACEPGQVSFEIDGPEEKASGLFTRALVDFITKTDGYVTGLKLDNELKEVTVAGNKQNPKVSGEKSVVLCKGLKDRQPLPPPKPKPYVELTLNKKPETAKVLVNGTLVDTRTKYPLRVDEEIKSFRITATASGYTNYDRTIDLGSGEHTVDIDMQSLLVGKWGGSYSNQHGGGVVILTVRDNLSCELFHVNKNIGMETIRFQFKQNGLSATSEAFNLSVGSFTMEGTVSSSGVLFDSSLTKVGIVSAEFSINFIKLKGDQHPALLEIRQ
jgi:hypothetical protein